MRLFDARYALFCLVGLSLCGAEAHAGTGPKLSAKAALVIHNASGKVLFAKSATTSRPIASLTKLQVALVVRRRGLALQKGTVLTRVDHQVALRGARTRLELKWKYRNLDLLHASLMASDNRATSALGRSVGLNANALVQAMNELARIQGLKKTTFRGPVGLDYGNKSTCWEVARIVRQASKDPVLRKVMGKSEYLLKPMIGYIKVRYRNTNPRVGKKASMKFLASKTGFNDKAGYCLAAVVKLPRLGEVTYVLLGSKSKWLRVVDQGKLLSFIRSQGETRLKASGVRL
ncbi:MAG: D-alanyl-D-alanine carboxypeptidase [Deltaproteobacteria bacterium]|nr:D-alanyl-D-alanine carboxypeptidase [Deltaproteobacteria bacterium]